MKLFDKFVTFIRAIDMFGIPNSLVLGRSMIYRSKFSGLISFCIYLAMIAIILTEFLKLLDK